MPCNCTHLITNTTKLLKDGSEVQESSFHCSKKRVSREDTKAINEAFQRHTQVSVAGYTCYYHSSIIVKYTDCPKFEEAK